jgi:ABC-type polysaccharide/polyol phosphate transport system ATPase subunit
METTADAKQAAVRLADVGKRYVKYDDVPLLVTRFRFRAGNRRTHLWALRHIDLDVPPGETFGVVGRNGSGKSTMLRMLAGVTAPTEGVVTVRGRVAPLISVGVGFHQELTGRENVYVNGSILGMTRRELDKRLDGIVDFAEIAEFIDTPVKFYSSGMLLRLGFSVAVAAEPEVLLVDEILAVGDFAFQQKCIERMERLKAQGTTVLMVSHNISAIRRLCSRVLVLHHGESRFLGGVDEGISVYQDLLSAQHSLEAGGDSPVQVTQFQLFDSSGKRTAHVQAGEEATFRLVARFDRAIDTASFTFLLGTDAGQLLYSEGTNRAEGRRFAAGESASFAVRFPVRLTTGSYTAHAGVRWGNVRGQVEMAIPLFFFVSGRPRVRGKADLAASMDIEGGVPIGPVSAPDAAVDDEFPDGVPSPEPRSF